MFRSRRDGSLPLARRVYGAVALVEFCAALCGVLAACSSARDLDRTADGGLSDGSSRPEGGLPESAAGDGGCVPDNVADCSGRCGQPRKERPS
jgi:hypothetical protein